MGISFSRPDPGSPAAVGSAQFGVVRRGYDQEEVRDFLRMVSSELARVHDRVRFLESELKAQQTLGLSDPGALDEETIAALVGEETARVLAVAREAAQQIRGHAAEEAERALRDAEHEARRVREEAMLDAVRQRTDLDSQMEAELELAKQQGRDMVAEARRFREEAVSDATRRRDQVKSQIEHLVRLRDRLVDAFERARDAAERAVGDLAEFDELADAIVEITGVPEVEPTSVFDRYVPAPQPVSYDEPTGEVLFFDHAKVPDAIPQRKVPHDPPKVPVDATPIMGTSLGFDTLERAEKLRRDGIDATGSQQRPSSGEDDGPAQSGATDAVPPDRTVPPSMASHPSIDHPVSGHMAVVVPLFDRGRRPSPAIEPTEARATEPIPFVAGGTDDAEPSEGGTEPVDAGLSGPESVEDPTNGTTGADDTAVGPPPVVRPTNPSVDAVFARLRASSTDRVASGVVAGDGASELGASAPVAEEPTDGQRTARRSTRRRPSLFSGTSTSPERRSKKTERTTGVTTPDAASMERGPEAVPVVVAPATVDPARFAEREAAIAAPSTSMTKKLKRLLADEENGALTRLQDRKMSVALESLFPSADAQVHAIVADLEDELMRIAMAGAKSVPGGGADLRATLKRSKVLSKVSRRVDEWIVRVLREQLQQCVETSNGSKDAMSSAVRGAYREWKLQRAEKVAVDLARLAYSRGAYLAIADGTKVCWVVDPDGPACADAEDNALAGSNGVGTKFPTGHSHPVAHPGCRCLIAPAPK